MTIEARALTKEFTTRTTRVVTALDSVDLEIPTGSITAVVGHSGAGKTTLGRCINLLERPSGGALLIDGVDVAQLSGRDRIAMAQSMGTIFQGSRLLLRRTALQNVMFPLELAGVPRTQRQRRAEELLARVGLADKTDTYPRQLSGGQAQRVGIARALALSPRVLISDEATSGLDPETTESILHLIREINTDDGLTVVLITHEMDVVRGIAERVVLMEAGRVVEQGRVDTLLVSPGSRLGQHLLPSRPARARHDEQVVLSVSYRRLDVPDDWLVTASQRLGAPIAILAGSVEQLPGGTAGRLTIGVPTAVVSRARAELEGLGIAVRGPQPGPPGTDEDPVRPTDEKVLVTR